jgi:hypothetical protein
MNGTSWVVVLWLLPATVFIIIPLFMLVIRGAVKLSVRIARAMNKPMSSSDYPAVKSGRSVE